jgi:hypothetical protein
MTLSRRFYALWAVLALVAVIAGWFVGHFQQGALKLSPFLCYDVPTDSSMMGDKVTLADQFNEKGREYSFTHLIGVCTPITDKKLPKDRKPFPVAKGDHLLCYSTKSAPPPKIVQWRFDDQFGPHPIVLRNSQLLCEPADKEIASG